ncbi:MAG: phosphoenolpyruvate carboxykinase (ATP) [Candidatus Cloacimonadota bacterium]|nr:phosphoenolpyruvate carboxykinase (ATP) [Candidatus Cloacimonadota bacterium]
MNKEIIKQYYSDLEKLLKKHKNVKNEMTREEMIKTAVENKEAVVSANGALNTHTPIESTGRSPKDTVMVKRPESEDNIDWDSPNNIPISAETFDFLYEDALEILKNKETLYITERVIGANPSFALPVRTITDMSLISLFADNMFRKIPPNIKSSKIYDKKFTLIALPYHKLNSSKYEGLLRKFPNGQTSNMVVAMDIDRNMGIIIGSAYCGSVKKTLFTVMNYYLPEIGILPLHCSANEGKNGDSALLLGLSGTGKTTLSADKNRALLGDDEHGWNDAGIANFENGCYAKLINLSEEKEPEIFNAVFHKDDYLNHGVIIENAMMYSDGKYDLCDNRLTPNSRASYPLKYLSNIKVESTSSHPNTILFLTADANGVIPPVSKLDINQARLWFLMGYTSKLAGTETGIKEPITTFSRFFGEPFMPRNPEVYAKMLGQKMKKHGTNVYLINTGWSGGAYGVGSRMDIKLTRTLVNAALNGDLEKVEYIEDNRFHIFVPQTCPNVDSKILDPKNTWENKASFEVRASKLAREFSEHFDKAYGNNNLSEDIIKQCPGK